MNETEPAVWKRLKTKQSKERKKTIKQANNISPTSPDKSTIRPPTTFFFLGGLSNNHWGIKATCPHCRWMPAFQKNPRFLIPCLKPRKAIITQHPPRTVPEPGHEDTHQTPVQPPWQKQPDHTATKTWKPTSNSSHNSHSNRHCYYGENWRDYFKSWLEAAAVSPMLWNKHNHACCWPAVSCMCLQMRF